MTTIRDIMQVGVGVPDRERFENFARDMLGLPASRSPDGKVTYVRTDRYQHRIAACTAPEPVLRYIGLDVGGPQQLAEWGIKLTAQGIHWRRSSPEECAERHVGDFIEFKDPDGHPLALSCGFGRQGAGALYP
jgi:catechol 2,3-dioxygenase-like lactoylglutathione lyase family enzyme